MKTKGFTLIEVLVAISIITVGIVGIYAIIPRIVTITSDNIDKFIASQLAKEGVEIIRNIRDENQLKALVFSSGLINCSEGCEIDYYDSLLTSYNARFLKIDTDGFYNYQSGEDTKFKRKITIVQGANVLDINVEIIRAEEDSFFQVKEKLYDWR